MKVIAGNDEIKKIESRATKLCESLGIDLTETDTKEDITGDDTKTHSLNLDLKMHTPPLFGGLGDNA